MLKFLGRRKRSRNIVLIIFVGLLALGLIVVFMPSAGGLRGQGGEDTVIAKVADREITLGELRTALSTFGRQIASGQGSTRVDDPSVIYANYGPQVIDNLVRQKLILYEADKLNFQTTDNEVQDRLKQLFNPWPGPEQYRARLQQVGVKPVEFEDNLRAAIAEEKLRGYIGAAIQVSPEEVEQDYRHNNTKYTVRWVEVNPNELHDKVQVDDAGLMAYFDEHKSDFRINQEQRRAGYVLVDQNKAMATVQVTDDELKQDFNPERGVQQVRVSQIVLDIPKAAPSKDAKTSNSNAAAPVTDPTAEAKNKAEDIVNRAKGTGNGQAEDFAALARQYSNDAKSKASGGDIGWINKNDKRETDDPLNRVFNMQQGDVSQPIRKGDKFYILKVTERKLPTFEEAREQLLKEARVKKSYTKAIEIAGEVQQKMKENKSADDAAKEINDKYGAEVATARQTPLFAVGDNIPDLGTASEFESQIFNLANPGDVTEPINVTGGIAVARYLEKSDPRDANFEDVKAKVENSYRAEKAKDLAAERARQLAQAQTGDALKAAVAAMGLKIDERESLTASDSIGSLVNEGNRIPIYNLSPGQVTHEPIKSPSDDTYVVASLLSRTDPDMGDAFKNQQKSIEENLLTTKRTALFMNYLEALEKRLKDAGDIKIYQSLIDSAIGAPIGGSPIPGPGQAGGFPGRGLPQGLPQARPNQSLPPAVPRIPGRTLPGGPAVPAPKK